MNANCLRQVRYSALLSCYLGNNFGHISRDADDDKIFHTRNDKYLVLHHHEQGVLEDVNGFFAHYNGSRWQLWESLPGLITVYRFFRNDNRLAA